MKTSVFAIVVDDVWQKERKGNYRRTPKGLGVHAYGPFQLPSGRIGPTSHLASWFLLVAVCLRSEADRAIAIAINLHWQSFVSARNPSLYALKDRSKTQAVGNQLPE